MPGGIPDVTGAVHVSHQMDRHDQGLPPDAVREVLRMSQVLEAMVGEIDAIGQAAAGLGVLQHREGPVVFVHFKGVGMGYALRPFGAEGFVHVGAIIVAVGSETHHGLSVQDLIHFLARGFGQVVLGDFGYGSVTHAAPSGCTRGDDGRANQDRGSP